MRVFKGIEKQIFRKLQACKTRVKSTKEYGKTLTAAKKRYVSYLSDYQYIFRSKTKKYLDKAEQYSFGILQSHRRNIEQVSDTLLESNYSSLHHFISDSNWDYRKAIDQAAVETSKTLPFRKLTGLIIDETGTVKKGDKSVGVGWQYCGNAGKTANSQVAVMACLTSGDFASLVDARLYLPKGWINDRQRCEKAGIPQEEIVFKTKLEIAYDTILNQLKLGTKFDYIGADGFYGNDADFASKIDDLGQTYMLDIHKDQPIYLEEPELYLPKKKNKKGRSSENLKATGQSTQVSEYCQALERSDWQGIKVRNTAKGSLRAQYHFVKVWIWNNTRNLTEPRLLVIRKDKTKKGFKYKYSFTNANPAQYTFKAIAYMQAQRYFIEHCIKESKHILGLSQFQTRKFVAWYHQVAMNIITMCFLLKEKLTCFDDFPLLSARDIREWLAFVLMKHYTEMDMLMLLYHRHYRRQTDINNRYLKEIANVLK